MSFEAKMTSVTFTKNCEEHSLCFDSTSIYVLIFYNVSVMKKDGNKDFNFLLKNDLRKILVLEFQICKMILAQKR